MHIISLSLKPRGDQDGANKRSSELLLKVGANLRFSAILTALSLAPTCSIIFWMARSNGDRLRPALHGLATFASTANGQ